MIVVDRHAFDRLWPALGVWLVLFITAGDAITLVRRQYVLVLGKPASGILAAMTTESVPMLGGRRRMAYFRYPGPDGHMKTAKEPVGSGHLRAEPAVHALGDCAFLDDDAGYSRWKGALFGAMFAALWLWALARYRFG